MSSYPLGGNGGILSDLMTSDYEDIRRIKVEEGTTSFDEGKIHRAHYELSLASNATRVIKFDVVADTILLLSSIDIDEGGIEYKVYSGGSESGTFTPIPVYPANSMSDVDIKDSSVLLSTGGNFDETGLTPNEIVRVRSSNANSKQSTVGTQNQDMRGFPAVTVYAVIKALSGVNGTSTGVLRWSWKSR